MKAYLIQLDIAWRNKPANFQRVRDLLSGVEPGSLVVLPEMFATGFDVDHGNLVEGTPGQLAETAEFLADLARDLQCTVQGSGIAPSTEGKRQNLAVIFGPTGEQVASFQKLHPFTFGGEHKRFTAGSDLVLYEAGKFTISPFICYDLRFPEVFRHATLRGAQILTVVANWPSPRHAHWLPLLQARAIENQCYVLGVNRAGRDKFLSYQGQSVAFGPQGEQLALAGSEECVLTVELDIHSLQSWRQEFPVLQDIRRKWLGLS
jgi:predicted amidohydrolase